VTLTTEGSQDTQVEGGHRSGKDINPWTFLQHYNIHPRKPEEMIPDTRVFEVYKKQVRIDIAGIRPILIFGNIYIIWAELIDRAEN
jgi:hypothetical protein